MKSKLLITGLVIPLLLAGCNAKPAKQTPQTTSSSTMNLSNQMLRHNFMGSYIAYTNTIIKQDGHEIGIIKTPMVMHIQDRNIYSGFGKSTIENTNHVNQDKLQTLIKTGLVVAAYGMTNYQMVHQTNNQAQIKLQNNSGLWPDKNSSFKNPVVELKLLDNGHQLTMEQRDTHISAATNPSYAMNIPTANRDKSLVAIPETDTANVTFSKITDNQAQRILKQKHLNPTSQGYGVTTHGHKDTK